MFPLPFQATKNAEYLGWLNFDKGLVPDRLHLEEQPFCLFDRNSGSPFLDQLVIDVFLRNGTKRVGRVEASGQLGAFALDAGVDAVTQLAARIIPPLARFLE